LREAGGVVTGGLFPGGGGVSDFETIDKIQRIKDMIAFLLWLLLLFVCWPLAILALVLYPIVWLFLLPFRLVGFTVDAVFTLLKSIIMLPAKVLGGVRKSR
jgi:hypothetical protein